MDAPTDAPTGDDPRPGGAASHARPREPAAVRDHLANERTLLAWIRTALTVIGLGFVVDRFALASPGAAAGSIVGAALIALGGLMAVAGAYRFVRTERQIDEATYHPSVRLHLLLTGGVVVGALAVMVFVIVGR